MNNKKILLCFIILVLIIVTLTFFYYYFYNKFNFNNKIVLYYTPWCHHCKEIKPKWQDFIKQYNGIFNNVKIETIDCDENKEIADKYNIDAIPSIIFHKDEEILRFTGEKEIDKIKDWIIEELK
tara:strand:+ start:322 stop:693 length:372 start_codon:yes stop_codon:yes gene_type:complete